MTSGAKVERWLTGCRELLALTQAQGAALAGEDYGRLEELFARRGVVMEKLGSLEGEDVGQEDPGWREVRRLLAAVTAVDAENQRLLQERLAGLKGSLKDVDKWRQAAQAYGGGELSDQGYKA